MRWIRGVGRIAIVLKFWLMATLKISGRRELSAPTWSPVDSPKFNELQMAPHEISDGLALGFSPVQIRPHNVEFIHEALLGNHACLRPRFEAQHAAHIVLVFFNASPFYKGC